MTPPASSRRVLAAPPRGARGPGGARGAGTPERSPVGPHPFTLRQLQYVVAVAEGLSFRGAAERCHVSQPALSAQIAQLESLLGVAIFERSRRGVLVTSAGRELVERARRLLVASDDLLAACRRAGDPLASTLRIGVLPTIAPYLLPAGARALRARFPHLTVAWREDRTEHLTAALAAGELDAALVALETELGEVEHEVIAEDPFVLAVGRDHPLARAATPARASDLRGEEVLLLDEGHCFGDQVLELCSAARARPGEFRATSLGTLVQMVAGSDAITLLPELAVATEAGRAELVVRPLAAKGASRTLALVWRRAYPLAQALGDVAAVLRDAFPKAVLGPLGLKATRRSKR